MSTLATTASHLTLVADILRGVEPRTGGHLLLVTDSRGETFVVGDEHGDTLEDLEAYELASSLVAHHDQHQTGLIAEVSVVHIERIQQWL